MMSHYKHVAKKLCGYFVLLAVMILPCHAQPSVATEVVDFAGVVLAAVGEAYAMTPDNVRRDLKRGDHFFSKDTIFTAANSSLTMRFIDGTLMDLKEKSTYKIINYHFKSDQPNKDSYAAELVEGGFRTITGELGKRNPDNYKVKARMTTLTVRGTAFTAAFSPGCTSTNVGAAANQHDYTPCAAAFYTLVSRGAVRATVGNQQYLLDARQDPGLRIDPNGTVAKVTAIPAAVMRGFPAGGFSGLALQGEAASHGTTFIQGQGRLAVPPPPPSGSNGPCQGVSSMSVGG